ncbi:MAG: class I SAM-dependent methyltransferase [Ardenticatenaceae bacterium]|nr:class I SAM-dependent methyltransferase [Ardenticatenaceae bacterium]MCB9444415.1 class I SAM-dependent methyltransferase [Ardenticatenaceae bacterium]
MASTRDALIAFWREEEAVPFQGWDFSYLHGRFHESPLPWDYMALARNLLPDAANVLDIGTGGGERLLALRDVWPPAVTVTEGWPPNVALAAERLGSLGVRIVAANHHPLPFAPGSFERIIDRHTGFRSWDIARILAPGGIFLTQQVDALWGWDLQVAMGMEVVERPSSYELALQYLRNETNLVIERAASNTGTMTFSDIGAVVYYLKAIPWMVPGFSVGSHLPYLLALQDRLERGEPLQFETRQYLLQAQRP